MPEVTPLITATNHFNLPASFGTKASETSEFQSFNPVFDGSGNYLCSAQYDTGDTFSQDADYCGGGAPNIVTALGRFLTEFGNVETAGIVQKLDATFAAGIQANVKIEGHQHDTNPHVLSTIAAPTLRVANVSTVIPAASGLGVPQAAWPVLPLGGKP